MRTFNDLHELITEAVAMTLDPEDMKLVDQQKESLKHIHAAMESLKGNISKMSGVDVRDVIKSLKAAKNRIEKNLSFIDRVFGKSGRNIRAA